MIAFLGRISLALSTGLLAGCQDGPFQVEEIERLPRELTVAEQELIAADNAFGLDLFQQIEAGADGDNIFISPLSVAMALGMTYNGAGGETREAMRQALHLDGLSLDEVNQSYRDLIDLLADLDPTVDFLLANSIWYREGFPVEPAFLEVNREYFDARVSALDFASPDAAATINAWVSEKTSRRITEIVASPIPNEIVMYLINAIYFKGVWTTQFDPSLTADRPFQLSDGGRVQVPMMRSPEAVEVGYYSDEDVEAVDITYGGQAYSMTILMPREAAGIARLASALDGPRWSQVVSRLQAAELVVVMPKFTLEYEIELRDALTALGMGVTFDETRADFGEIYSGPERLYLSRVKHKTFVEVNEEGTEAAAATGVEVGVTSAPPTVTIDRPFVFAIREKFSGTILFLGSMRNPSLTD